MTNSTTSTTTSTTTTSTTTTTVTTTWTTAITTSPLDPCFLNAMWCFNLDYLTQIKLENVKDHLKCQERCQAEQPYCNHFSWDSITYWCTLSDTCDPTYTGYHISGPKVCEWYKYYSTIQCTINNSIVTKCWMLDSLRHEIDFGKKRNNLVLF